MTNEQINISIAEACGWKPDKRGLGWLSPHGYYAPEPDYCNDLNEMHEAEKMLNKEQWVAYGKELSRLNVFPMVHATAKQRVEAFLRTLEKWEE